jgi:hypothetical protein
VLNRLGLIAGRGEVGDDSELWHDRLRIPVPSRPMQNK